MHYSTLTPFYVCPYCPQQAIGYSGPIVTKICKTHREALTGVAVDEPQTMHFPLAPSTTKP